MPMTLLSYLGPKQSHALLADIRSYCETRLKLELKGNYQVFAVKDRGIDFIGYVFYHNYTLLRKSIKKNLARKVKRHCRSQTLASYKGWMKHCDSKHLQKKLFNEKV